MAAVHDLAERQLHLQGDVAAARRAADEAHLHAATQRSEQQQQAEEGTLPPAERSRLARAVLQLHQQQARAGDAPADVSELLAPFGLAGLGSAPGFEFADSSKSSSEPGNSANVQLAAIQAEFDAELGRLAADDGSSAAAAALSDGPKPLDN